MEKIIKKQTFSAEISTGEIVMYQPDGNIRLEVKLENESVWLTQAQMADFFILHNTLPKFKPTKLYSLDVIISVGYRVKSVNGTRFRRWANQVLREHLLKGFSINQRFLLAQEQIDMRFDQQENRISALEKRVDFFVNGPKAPAEGMLKTKSNWDGFALVANLVRTSKRIVLHKN
ncbi:MAG: virulence RhuM family protein [Fibrobacteraceae bacterium]|nr:virulence RhuM family protein [Fibrobacteraceae bacterium]